MRWYHYVFGYPFLMLYGMCFIAYFLITGLPVLLPVAILAAPVQVWCDITHQNPFKKPWYVRMWVIPFYFVHKWYIWIFFFGLKQINPYEKGKSKCQ